jgi:predicted transposase YdaD
MRQVELEETGMNTFATVFEELGRAEGRVEGRTEGQRDVVLRLLNRKVGPLTDMLQARVATLAPEALISLSEVLLDFTGVDDLTAWLDQHGSATGT